MDIPYEIYNWAISYLNNQKHFTKFNNDVNDVACINAGVIQGSSLGPILFSIVMSSLKTLYRENSLFKYADDCFLVIPEANIQQLPDKMNHIVSWGKSNNLVVNHRKCKLMGVYSRNKRKIPDLNFNHIHDISIMNELNILGVTVQTNFSLAKHVSTIVNKCNKLFYLLRILKGSNLDVISRRDFFMATIYAHITFAANAWYWFCHEEERSRLCKIMKHGVKLNILDAKDADLDKSLEARARKLFLKIVTDELHVLHHLLLPKKRVNYSLCEKTHGLCLPPIVTPHDTNNFIIHMMYL